MSRIPGVGVNVRINEITPALLASAAALGFTWLRTDVRWARVEAQVGTFDFTTERRAFSAARSAGFDVLAILDYGHPVHTGGRAPASAPERARFAAFAAEAERSLGTLVSAWEIWNEPNHPQFWPPAPNPQDFVALLNVTANAIWDVRRDRRLVTGGLSGLDLPYLERIRPGVASLARRGPVALSIHPYRTTPPETLVDDLSHARLIDATGTARTPDGVGIWVSEWGYCRLWAQLNPIRQGELDVRAALVTAGLGVPVTIVFELVDGGPQTQSAYTCGLLEAQTLQLHPAADVWRQAAPLLARREAGHPGISTGPEHWTIAAVGGQLSWGDARSGSAWCPVGSSTARIGDSIVCYAPDR